ncbi:hypothetical protein AYI69_g5330 [Smittium culicis]|uniref:Uncharacterized protein n=1 Tax=Smittium culicis TaxID=133412 RepID=A0A1R1Y6L8_9FUNG|nr:hypothetical protein AYI69_g5330 [Smittium culicis]
MDHDLEIQSWHILIACTVLRASRRVSGFKTLSDNLYQRLDLYTESMDGCRRLRDRINGIEVSAASHANIYRKVMGECQEFPKKKNYLCIRFESAPVIRMLVDLWYASMAVLSEHRILGIPQEATL